MQTHKPNTYSVSYRTLHGHLHAALTSQHNSRSQLDPTPDRFSSILRFTPLPAVNMDVEDSTSSFTNDDGMVRRLKLIVKLCENNNILDK